MAMHAIVKEQSACVCCQILSLIYSLPKHVKKQTLQVLFAVVKLTLSKKGIVT